MQILENHGHLGRLPGSQFKVTLPTLVPRDPPAGRTLATFMLPVGTSAHRVPYVMAT